jgi:hypothetical protein
VSLWSSDLDWDLGTTGEKRLESGIGTPGGTLKLLQEKSGNSESKNRSNPIMPGLQGDQWFDNGTTPGPL